MGGAQAFAAALAGVGLGFSLIVAVGPQNLFVLRQGILRRGVPLIVGLCAVSDVVLIVAGVAGGAHLLGPHPRVLDVVRVAGAAFLLASGARAARRAWRGPDGALEAPAGASRASIAGTCLAFTWLNPAVYLDTVVVIGSVANSDPAQHWSFGAGAALASVVWFAVLGFGARILAPVFSRPTAWRLLDAFTAVVMAVVAVRVVLGG